MDPVSAGLQFGSAYMNYSGSRSANATARHLADQTMNFQKRMSDTAHRREVIDLKKAGLNPILSANKGASAPMGATAPVENEMEGVAQSAAALAQLRLESRRLEAELENTKADTAKKKMETDVISKDIPKAEAQNWFWDQIKSTAKDALNAFGPKSANPRADQAAKALKQKYDSARPEPVRIRGGLR